MKRTWHILSGIATAAVVGVLAPLNAGAESRAQSGDAGDFLKELTCSGAPCYEPTAGGAKIFGTMSVVYDKQPGACPNKPLIAFVRNMYVNLTMDQGGVRVPFSTDYLNGPPRHDTGFCLLANDREQAEVIIELIRAKVVAFFFACDPDGACPGFRVKSISNFQYTTGHPSLAPYPHSGGFSADIVIAIPEK